MKLRRLKGAVVGRDFCCYRSASVLLLKVLKLPILSLLLLLSTSTRAQQDDYTPTGGDEYTTRCLDEQCDCDKLSSAVICSDSDFTSIPNRQIVSLPFSVSRLTLTRNKFSVNGELGSENFTGLASFIEELVLQECSITKLRPGVFTGMSRLIYLDLSMNKLQKLTKRQFSMLSSLEVLVLSGNRGLRIDHETFSGSSASELALDECGLTELPKTVQSFPIGLRRLYLQDNRLQTVPAGLKPLFDEFEDVRLRGNRWHCDSRIGWLLDIFHRRRDAFSDDPVCESPEPMNGRRFSTVSPSEAAMKVAIQFPNLPPDSSEDDQGPIDIYEMAKMSTSSTPSTTTLTSTTTTITVPPTTRRTTSTTSTTMAPETTTTTSTTITTVPEIPTTTWEILRYSSTIVALSRENNNVGAGGGGGVIKNAHSISNVKVAQSSNGQSSPSSSEWQIDYPTGQDETRAREYEEAYELRERVKNKGKTENAPEAVKPVAVVRQETLANNNVKANTDYDGEEKGPLEDDLDVDGPALGGLDDEDDDAGEEADVGDIKSQVVDKQQNNLIDTPRQILPTLAPSRHIEISRSSGGAGGKQRSSSIGSGGGSEPSASGAISSFMSPQLSTLATQLFLFLLLHRVLINSNLITIRPTSTLLPSLNTVSNNKHFR